MFRSGSDALAGEALFFYTKLIEHGVQRADRDAIVGRLLAALSDAEWKPLGRGAWLSPGRRAMHSLATIASWLNDAELRSALDISEMIAVRDNETACAAVLNFWADLVKPSPYSFRLKRLSDERAREVVATVLDRVLNRLDSDSREVSRAAWSALARFGPATPRADHPLVLERVIGVWSVDRGIDPELLVTVVEAYVGPIPERMAAEVERHRAERAEIERDAR